MSIPKTFPPNEPQNIEGKNAGHVVYGHTEFPSAGNQGVSVDIEFPDGLFDDFPAVTPSIEGNYSKLAEVYVAETRQDGATLRLYTTEPNLLIRGTVVNWIAAGA